MNTQEKKQLCFWIILLLPLVSWWVAVRLTQPLDQTHYVKELLNLMRHTHQKPKLWGAVLAGVALAIGFTWLVNRTHALNFSGAYFKRFIRGTRMVSSRQLKAITLEKNAHQITVAGIPIPRSIENLHFLIGGATGAGKSVLMREVAFKALLRGDRLIVVDPKADMLSKFYKVGDVILNPYDQRTQGWSIFNELRHEYDFEHYAYALVPLGKNTEEEEWAGYARLLVQEVSKKLALTGKPSIHALWDWVILSDEKELKAFVAGTPAESLFVGADKALKSVRFVLSKRLSPHLKMPQGPFSLRNWLDNPTGGNLYITWKDGMEDALRPLMNTWLGILTTSILSMEEDEQRRIWLFLDELASLDKLKDLKNALTKGRKMGLCVMAGLQSTAQLNENYGNNEAKTLRSCLRSLVVLGGSKTDPDTCEDLSRSLSEHEVERESESRNDGNTSSTSTRMDIVRERVVMPAEIANLPELTGFVYLAGDRPLAKVTFEYMAFKQRTPAFVEGGI
jgi:type IV secretory pathway TraG/TraD family ATPase VirD4